MKSGASGLPTKMSRELNSNDGGYYRRERPTSENFPDDFDYSSLPPPPPGDIIGGPMDQLVAGLAILIVGPMLIGLMSLIWAVVKSWLGLTFDGAWIAFWVALTLLIAGVISKIRRWRSNAKPDKR